MSPKLSNGWTTFKCHSTYQMVESRILNTFQSDWLLTSLSGPRAKAWPLAIRSLPFCLCRYLFCQVLGVENCIGGGRGHDTRYLRASGWEKISKTCFYDSATWCIEQTKLCQRHNRPRQYPSRYIWAAIKRNTNLITERRRGRASHPGLQQ